MFILPMKTDWDGSNQEVVSNADLTRVSANLWQLHHEDFIYRVASRDFRDAVSDFALASQNSVGRSFITVPVGASVNIRKIRMYAAFGVSNDWNFGYRITTAPGKVRFDDPGPDPDLVADVSLGVTGYNISPPEAWIEEYGILEAFTNETQDPVQIRIDFYSGQLVGSQNHNATCEGFITVDVTPV